MIKPIYTAIFDLDGTLVNSVEDLADATNTALCALGFPTHPLDSYYYFVGDGVRMLFERALPENERTEENISLMKTHFDRYYNSHFDCKTRPYDGICEALSTLKSAGFKLAVASNKPDEFVKKIVSTFFRDTFDCVAGKLDGVPTKPSPDIVISIMKALDSTRERTIMIGDTNVDIRTAKAAEIASVGCLWGFRTRDELESAGADYIAESPSEMAKHILTYKGV